MEASWVHIGLHWHSIGMHGRLLYGNRCLMGPHGIPFWHQSGMHVATLFNFTEVLAASEFRTVLECMVYDLGDGMQLHFCFLPLQRDSLRIWLYEGILVSSRELARIELRLLHARKFHVFSLYRDNLCIWLYRSLCMHMEACEDANQSESNLCAVRKTTIYPVLYI